MSKYYYRYFTDNDKYGERKTPYLDSLAYTIQEFLYSKDKAKQEIIYKERVFDDYTETTHTNKKTKSFDCEMDGRIQLYDFVTMTLHLINTLPSDFAKVQLKEYLADLKKKDGISYREEIRCTQNGIYLYNTSKEMIFALLWAAWIYMKVFLDLNPNKMLEKRVDMLYDAMKENYPFTEENLEKHPLIAHAPDAMTLMCQHIKAKSQKSKRSKSPEKEATEDGNAKLLARIAELDAEIASLKQQLEECQNNDSYNDEQEAKQDEKVLYNKVSHEFFLRLLEKAGLDLNNTGNKTRVGDLWHMVTGKAGDEIRRYCSTRNYINPHTIVDIKRLNELLQDMKIGDFQLPIS